MLRYFQREISRKWCKIELYIQCQTDTKSCVIYRVVIFFNDLISNPDFNSTLLFNVEYLRNDTRYTHGYYRPLIESWRLAYWIVLSPMTLTSLQGQSVCILCLKKYSILFRSLIESPGGLTKDDIADDLEWSLNEGHFRYCKRFHCLCLKIQFYSIYNVRSQLQWPDVVCEQWFISTVIFDRNDSYMMLSATC